MSPAIGAAMALAAAGAGASAMIEIGTGAGVSGLWLTAQRAGGDAHELALRLARPGGSVLVPRVLQRGRVADESHQDAAAVVHRALLRAVRERDDLLAGMSTVGDGLLHVARP